jgi:hypothetical protein
VNLSVAVVELRNSDDSVLAFDGAEMSLLARQVHTAHHAIEAI